MGLNSIVKDVCRLITFKDHLMKICVKQATSFGLAEKRSTVCHYSTDSLEELSSYLEISDFLLPDMLPNQGLRFQSVVLFCP